MKQLHKATDFCYENDLISEMETKVQKIPICNCTIHIIHYNRYYIRYLLLATPTEQRCKSLNPKALESASLATPTLSQKQGRC